MRYLVLSDIHANQEALDAVLGDAAGQYDRIVCCGDLVGYGPDPNSVAEWAKENLHALVRGNHDKGCSGVEDLEWFNPVARRACLWTAQRLTSANRLFLCELAGGPFNLDGFQLVHGSPLDEDEYLISLTDARAVFPHLESNLVFFGHTHVQCAWARQDGRYQAITRPGPDESELRMRLSPDGVYLVNPGSVGQPRDGDFRAAYAIYDTSAHEVTQRRCRYDSIPTRRKILAAGLPDILAARLETGR
jgi:predicted phosphodiesterase